MSATTEKETSDSFQNPSDDTTLAKGGDDSGLRNAVQPDAELSSLPLDYETSLELQLDETHL